MDTPLGYKVTPTLRPNQGGNTMATTEFQVTGMTCGHCEGSIRSEVSQIPGVSGIDVSAATGHLSVTTSGDPVDNAAVLAAVEEAGYEAVTR